VSRFVGTSAGGLIALLLALGLDQAAIEAFMQTDVPELFAFPVRLGAALELLRRFGLNDGACLRALAARALHRGLGRDDVTFAELRALTGRDLVLTGSNLTRRALTWFSADDTPGLSVVTALRVTASLPPLFEPVTLDGELYVDGGVTANLPLRRVLAEGPAAMALNLACDNAAPRDLVQYLALLLDMALETGAAPATDAPASDAPDGPYVWQLHVGEPSFFDAAELRVAVSADTLRQLAAQGEAQMAALWPAAP
jgi:predicted acylesterase/phospholipase RssA